MPTVPNARQMLEQLIASPSVSSTHEGLDTSNIKVIELLAEWLHSAGFEIEIDQVSERPHKANLIARSRPGDDGLVLSGHTDTVPCDENLWRSSPYEIDLRGDRLHGLGTADMKSFFALVLSALENIDLKKLNKPLVILATADEESTMAGAKQLLKHERRLGKYCVIGEPTCLRPVHQHKGIFMESVTLLGRSGHSSDPALGNNALEGMHEIIQAILQYRDTLGKQFVDHDFAVPYPTLNLGHIHGGDNANRICGNCSLHYDVRLLPDMDLENVRTNLRDIILAISEKRNLECSFSSLFDGTPALSTPSDAELVSLTEQLTQQASHSVVFATEGPYFSQLGMETVILGPGSIDVAHQPNEYIEQKQMKQSIEIYRQLIQKICAS